MFKWISRLIDSNEKELKRLQPIVERINSLEPELERLSDAELRAKTDEFKIRLQDGESLLDELLPEAYASVREAAKRTIGQRHFDVQLMGGLILHQGKIAEMKTGEGKTLVATLPLYLNALTGKGCHLVTVNDYLARRDCHWMGPIYDALGVSVACINAQQSPGQTAPSYIYDGAYDSGDPKWRHLRPITRRQAYEADITYGTNNEFGFDYLRDNMVLDLSQCVQRPLNYAIIDEVDNILIDEARTPLIISGAAAEATQKYYTFAQVVSRLVKDEDYTIDERTRTASPTDTGITKIEKTLKKAGLLKGASLYDPANYFLTQYLESALKAYALFNRDRDYVIKNGQVIIVDEFTGRLMFGRRYSEGLHQAIEAKEKVKIQQESVTLATITFQNYFRLYQKLAGMTGTATTEAEELYKTYKLEVLVIPTNKPLIRTEYPDQIYKDEEAKFKAVIKEIEQSHSQGRPVLVGTTSIEKSERLSDLLTKKGIPHQVLNAKNHEKEAGIIAQAGRLGAVTIATQMAGRGVDIILGGNPEGRDPKEWLEEHNKVVALGGLHILGTEHYEARRVGNQLRGRAGRQGDPGSSRFYASLEDEIVRRFGGDRVKGLMQWAGMDENTPIEHPLISKAIANAQVQIEGYHFDIRKHLLEYDDVVNKHREVIYAERKKILSGADLKTNIISMIHDEIQSLVTSHFSNAIASQSPDSERSEEEGKTKQSDLAGLLEDISIIFPLPPQFRSDGLSELSNEQIMEKLNQYALELYNQREQEIGPDKMRLLERFAMLIGAEATVKLLNGRYDGKATGGIDLFWMEHLTAMEHLRQGIGLQAVGQQDPLVVYKKEGHALFQALLASIQHDVVRSIYHVSISKEPPRQKQAVAAGKKVGRNDPCPCGSGKKYKHCCGK